MVILGSFRRLNKHLNIYKIVEVMVNKPKTLSQKVMECQMLSQDCKIKFRQERCLWLLSF